MSMSQTTADAQGSADTLRRLELNTTGPQETSSAPSRSGQFSTAGQRASWAAFLRGLEASHRLNFVPTGEKLERGRVYIDLRQPCRGAFRALEGQTAGSRNRFLAQEDVPMAVWCGIIEHCACVDAETGLLGATHHIPCNRLGTFTLPGSLSGVVAA